jgi:chemotaxis protein CheZ
MAAPRKVFRIEQSGTARSERPASEADESRDSPMLRELGALRAMLAPPPAAPHVNGTLARQDELQRLASELRLLLAAIRGAQQGHMMNGGLSAPTARIAEELDAVIQDSELAAQKILTAAEHIDQAATNLMGLLKGNFECGLTQDIRDRVTHIFEACNFQDLTSQRVAKVRASFDTLHRQIARVLEELARADAAPPLHGPRLGDDAGHVSQGDIDSLFDGDVDAVW